jgi:hypothetical protein
LSLSTAILPSLSLWRPLAGAKMSYTSARDSSFD